MRWFILLFVLLVVILNCFAAQTLSDSEIQATLADVKKKINDAENAESEEDAVALFNDGINTLYTLSSQSSNVQFMGVVKDMYRSIKSVFTGRPLDTNSDISTV
jgi:hypothetical protein